MPEATDVIDVCDPPNLIKLRVTMLITGLSRLMKSISILFTGPVLFVLFVAI